MTRWIAFFIQMRYIIFVLFYAIATGGWAGVSAYHIYENNKPVETIYADLGAINDYMDSLNGEE